MCAAGSAGISFIGSCIPPSSPLVVPSSSASGPAAAAGLAQTIPESSSESWLPSCCQLRYRSTSVWSSLVSWTLMSWTSLGSEGRATFFTRGRPTWTAENIGRPPGTPFTRDMSFLALDAAVPCCWIRCSRMLLRAAQRRCAEHLYIMGMRAECWVDSSIHVWIKKVKLKAELGMQQSFRFATNENAITC